MKLFVEMRNISLKEHTSETLTLSASEGKFETSNAVIEHTPKGDIQIKIPFVGLAEKILKPYQLHSSQAYFYNVPNWFDENPDVMYICRKYLAKLEKFFSEAEDIARRKKDHE